MKDIITIGIREVVKDQIDPYLKKSRMKGVDFNSLLLQLGLKVWKDQYQPHTIEIEFDEEA